MMEIEAEKIELADELFSLHQVIEEKGIDISH